MKTIIKLGERPLMKFRHLSIALAAALAISSPLLAESTQPLQLNIASQSLSSALGEFAKQSKLQLVADSKLLEGKKAPTIKGAMNLKEALSKLLKDSGLEASVEGSTIVIKKQNESEVALDAITIQAEEQSGTTEGTGSYTSKSMRTATKLNLSSRETPQSVTVLTSQKLEDLGVTSYQEMLNNVAGISLNRWDERVYPTARGFDVDYYLLDGIPTYSISDSAANDIDLSLYDRVEVVKGANGLMTGAGNPAVGLNFVRKHATSKEVKGNVEVAAGSWDAYSSSMDVSSPLNEEGNVRGRVVAKHEDKKSYMNGYEKTNDVFYGVVDMDITENTYLSIAAEYQKLDRSGIRWGGLPAFYSDGTRTNFSRSQTVSEDWTYWNSETKAAYLDFKQYVYNDVSLNLAYSYRKLYSDTSLLYFGGTVDEASGVGEGYVYRYINEALTNEQNIDIYVSAPFKLGGLEHEIVLGMMQNQSDMKHDRWGMDFPVSSIASPLINFNNINVANPYLQASSLTTPHETTQRGMYVAGKISLSDSLKLISGLRVSDWKYSSDTGVGNRSFNDELTPYAGLVYNLNDNHSVYVSYTNIFKPQDKQGANGEFLDPITGNNYEAGIKGEYFGKRLNTSLSIFRIEQENVAEEMSGVFVPGTTNSAYKAVDGVVSKGFELDINGEIMDNWNMGLGIANFEAEDANGNKVTTTSSRTMANLFTKYTLEKFGFGVGLNYRSKIYTGSGATQIVQDAYVLTNAMISYAMDKHTKLQFNVNNIFDKKYYEGIGANGMVYGAPLNAMFSIKYSF